MLPIEFSISREQLVGVKGDVVLVTGGSSGIGLATTKLLLELGALVVAGDISPSPIQHPNFDFIRTNAASWADLRSLFKYTYDKHHHIDHVFVNAGIDSKASYLDETFDLDGGLLEPSQQTYDVNLRGAINTAYLGLHYMRRNSPIVGSIVLTASASSFQRFRDQTDYAVSKHGLLGFMRSIVPTLQAERIPIRVNAIAPSWTETGMVSRHLFESAGGIVQTTESVADAVVLLMADPTRQGQLLYIEDGKYADVDESVLLPAAASFVGEPSLDKVMANLVAMRSQVT